MTDVGAPTTHMDRGGAQAALKRVVAGDAAHGQWRTVKGRYLSNEGTLARVFRARMLQGLNEAGLALPAALPDKWVAHCRRVGRGAPALDYLARYLYRGVISEANILGDRDGRVTFRYIESRTGEVRTAPARWPARTSSGSCSSMSCPGVSVACAITASSMAMPGVCSHWSSAYCACACRRRPRDNDR